MIRRGYSPDRRRELRQQQTDAEARLWYFLKSRHLGGFKFRRQHSVGPYILDFYCPSAGLAVELDGSQHGNQLAYDERRTAFLAGEGIRVVRFTNDHVLRDPLVVLEKIRGALT